MSLQIILKNSAVSAKEPTVDQLANGELALNFHADGPFLSCKDTAGVVRRVAGVWISSTAPATPTPGEFWLDIGSTPALLKVYKDSTDTWVGATTIYAASTSQAGIVELATDAETQTGSDFLRAVTPASLQSKLSSSAASTSTTAIANSAAVKTAKDAADAAQATANAALARTGGTITGNLEIGTTGSLSFEGATADGFETTIAVVDPTADNTITLPNVSGTVVTTGDTGTVTSTMLADGTIVDADINASAAIAHGKLANITAGRVLLGNASNVPTATALSGDVTVSSTGVTTIAVGAVTTGKIADGTIVDADISATAEIAVSKLADGAARQLLQTDAAGTGVEWASNVDIPGTLDVTGAATFDAAVTITGDLTVNGTTTNINTTNLVVEDKNIILGDVATPSDTTADGGGITLKGATDKTITWSDATDSWTFNQPTITTGSSTAASFIPTSSTVPTNGVYLPAANSVAISSNSVGRVFVDASGNVKLGSAAASGFRLAVDGDTWFGNQTGTEIGRLFNDAGVLCLRASSNVTGLGLATNSSSSHAIRISSTGLVGIGTTSASFPLEVNGNARVSNLSVPDTNFIGFGGFTSYISGSSASNFLTLNTGATERLRITPSGFVGVNTSAPVGQFSVNASGTGPVGFNGGPIATPVKGNLFWDTDGSGWQFRIGKLQSGTFTPQMTFTESGFVGVNTTVPNAHLHVQSPVGGSGVLRVSDSTNTFVARLQANAADGSINLFNENNYSLTFGTNNTERMRIGNNGATVITHPNNVYQLYLVNGAGSGLTDALLRMDFSGYSPNNTAAKYFYCGDTLAVRAELRANGGLANFQANNVNLSDINAKKDIAPAAGTWDCIKEWEIVNYRYKDQPDDADLNLGVIAQQVAENCPEVITIFQEAKEATEDHPAQEERLGVKEQQMYWMAIKALQEAQQRIETLEAKVAALEAA